MKAKRVVEYLCVHCAGLIRYEIKVDIVHTWSYTFEVLYALNVVLES